MNTPARRQLSQAEAAKKIARYCAYQERSHHQVREKLLSYGLPMDQADELLTELITGGFLNEERFAKAFAGGRFRMKQWGWNKIRRALKSHGLTDHCIEAAYSEITPEAYQQTLTTLLEKKIDDPDDNPLVTRQRAATYAIGKGYEPELVWTLLKQLLPG